MLKHGKSYLVTERTEETNIYRGGKLVGTFPEVGYQVQVFGVCSGLAGTELAAHALAEVHKDVSPYSRRWVLTEAEYEEHVGILKAHSDRLMATYPYTEEEATSVKAHNDKYADIQREGAENIKRQLMNLPPHRHITWDPNPVRRPKEFPALPEEDEVASFGMR